MLKYLMKLRHRKGFTLTELIIVIAIIAILMGCVAAFSGPIRQMVKATAASTDALTANKIIGDYLENRLAFADNIDIYYSVNAADGAAVANAGDTTKLDIPQAFDKYKIKDDTANTRDKSGVIIIHYDPNEAEPEKSTYKLYDYPITSASSNYATTVIKTVGTDSVLNEDGAVFDDAFYTNSQNLIIAPTEIDYNNSRGTLNMSFQIIPYDCDEDYITRNSDGTIKDSDSEYIKPEILSDYYKKYVTHSACANPTTCTCDKSYGLNSIKNQRSGAIETITFSLNNIRVADEKKFVIDASGYVTNNIDYDNSNYQWHAREPGVNAVDAANTDIVIFYHIPYYGG